MPKQIQPIRDLQGLNRKDSGEKVRDNEFLKLQNVTHVTRGVHTKRFGSTFDLEPSDIVGENRATGIHRMTDVVNARNTFYICEPDKTIILPKPVAGSFGVAKVTTANGTLTFAGSRSLRVTYVGMGQESQLVIIPAPASGGAENAITITWTPATIPTQVRSINFFWTDAGSATSVAFVGVAKPADGTITIEAEPIGIASLDDQTVYPGVATVSGVTDGSGVLKPGNYHIGIMGVWRDTVGSSVSIKRIVSRFSIRVKSPENAISVSTDATPYFTAPWGYVFIGVVDPLLAPMQFVGFVKFGTTSLTITDLPKDINVASQPYVDNDGADRIYPWFSADGSGTTNEVTDDRGAFVIKRSPDDSLSEIMMNRTAHHLGHIDKRNGTAVKEFKENMFQPDTVDPTIYDLYNTDLNMKVLINGFIFSSDDRKESAYLTSRDVSRYVSPNFSDILGISIMANGVNIPLVIDGYSICFLCPKATTTPLLAILPRPPQFVGQLKNFVTFGGVEETPNQLFGSNALEPQNWVTGGSGSALRFVTPGEFFGLGITAVGLYSLDTTDQGPQTRQLAFKKNTVWTASTIPDPVGGIGTVMDELSNKTGCQAYRTVVNTEIGVMFLGSDAEPYLIRSVGEPIQVGRRVAPFLAHLAEDPALMKKCSAVFHNNTWKLSYPSTSTSTGNDAQLWANIDKEDQPRIQWNGPHTGVNIDHQIVFDGEDDDLSRHATLSDQFGVATVDDTSTVKDFTTDIVSIVESKKYRFKNEVQAKRFFNMWFDLFYDSKFDHEITVDMFADEEFAQKVVTLASGGGVYGTSDWDQANYTGELFKVAHVPIGPEILHGTIFQWRLTHSNPAPIVIAAALIEYAIERRKNVL